MENPIKTPYMCAYDQRVARELAERDKLHIVDLSEVDPSSIPSYLRRDPNFNPDIPSQSKSLAHSIIFVLVASTAVVATFALVVYGASIISILSVML